MEEAELEKERGWRGAEERVSMRELGGSPPELQHARARPDARATWQMKHASDTAPTADLLFAPPLPTTLRTYSLTNMLSAASCCSSAASTAGDNRRRVQTEPQSLCDTG